jgi:hypothetical protein
MAFELDDLTQEKLELPQPPPRNTLSSGMVIGIPQFIRVYFSERTGTR